MKTCLPTTTLRIQSRAFLALPWHYLTMVNSRRNKTAIKIPGKRSRSTKKVDVEFRKKLNRPPGRPLKLASSETSVATSDRSVSTHKKLKVRTLKNIKSKRDMSLLERLPTELLEQIFSYSMNLELPKSSPVIGGKLSSEVVYNRTILSAFEATWGKYYTSEKNTSSHTINGDVKLQSAILRCRWASLPRLLQNQDICIRRQNAQRAVLEPNCTKDEIKGRAVEEIALSPKTVAERFNENFEELLHTVNVPKQENLQGCIVEYHYEAKDIAQGVEIPHSLLLGPWTEEMTQYLYWLVKSGATLNWHTSTSGEAAFLGLQNAISTANFAVIYLLVRAGLKHKLDATILTWALQNAKDNKNTIMGYLLAEADLRPPEVLKLECELAVERDRAKQEFNQERLIFLDTVKAAIEYL